jgi:hypothetical protein
VNFLFFARLLFPIARAHQDSSPLLAFALVHFAAGSGGGGRGGRSEGRGRDGGGGGERERERLRCASRRRRLPFNFARKRKLAGPPRKWAANRKKTVALNGAWFVKSYCLGRGVRRVPKANRSISRIGECAIAVYLRIEAERNG